MDSRRSGGTRWTGLSAPIKYKLPFGKSKEEERTSTTTTTTMGTPTTTCSSPSLIPSTSSSSSLRDVPIWCVGGQRLSLNVEGQLKRGREGDRSEEKADVKKSRLSHDKDKQQDDDVLIVDSKKPAKPSSFTVSRVESDEDDVQVLGVSTISRVASVSREGRSTSLQSQTAVVGSTSSVRSDRTNLNALPQPDKFRSLLQRLAIPLEGLTQERIGKLDSGRQGRHCYNLSVDIWKHFKDYVQPSTLFNTKLRLWQQLSDAMSRRVSGRFLVFGSTVSGFGSKESDIDLCLVTQSVLSGGWTGKDASINSLREVRKSFSFLGKDWDREMTLIPSAKVPILKMYNRSAMMEVDINCNNVAGFRNTHLLFCYGQIDWRVRPLVLTIKSWATEFGIKDARDSTFSSYTLTLLVINFLQCGLEKPLLPSLQALHPNVFHSKSDIASLSFFEPIDTSAFVSSNDMSLGELFKAFIGYYAVSFDFSSDVASVRTAQRLHLHQCKDESRRIGIPVGQWRAYVAVEDPLEFFNAARAIINRQKFDDIVRAFARTKRLLDGGAKLEDLTP